MGRSVLDTPLVAFAKAPADPFFPIPPAKPWRRRVAGYDRESPACFPTLLAPNKDREIGGGRATRQPGQVRKEAALTRSGSGRSSVSYLFFERIARGGGPYVRPARAPFRKARPSRDIQLRIDR